MKKLILVVLMLFCYSVCSAGELSFLAGNVTYNNDNNKGTAWQVDYRQSFMEYLGLSVSYLNEGHVADHKRDGFMAQGWLISPKFLYQKFSLGLGVGPYFSSDTYKGEIDHNWALATTLSLTFYINDTFFVRGNWNRITVSGNADTDVATAGIGFRF
jgi:hypothetical protein